MNYIWLIILVIFGVFMIIKPELLWKIEHIFTVKNGEPTDLYLGLMRISGVFFIICALGVLLFTSLDDKNTCELDLPEQSEVQSVLLEKDSDSVELTKDDAEEILALLYSQIWKSEWDSVQDYPANVEDLIKIDLQLSKGGYRSVFVYKRGFGYYMEQSYNGIYKITEDEYDIVGEYFESAE